MIECSTEAFSQFAHQCGVIHALGLEHGGIEVVEDPDDDRARIYGMLDGVPRSAAEFRRFEDIRLWVELRAVEAIDQHGGAIDVDPAEEVAREVDGLYWKVEAAGDQQVDGAKADGIGFSLRDAPGEVGITRVVIGLMVAAQWTMIKKHFGKAGGITDSLYLGIIGEEVECVREWLAAGNAVVEEIRKAAQE